jgi:hypothetical protein
VTQNYELLEAVKNNNNNEENNKNNNNNEENNKNNNNNDDNNNDEDNKPNKLPSDRKKIGFDPFDPISVKLMTLGKCL